MVGSAKGEQVQIAVYIAPGKAEKLKQLCDATRIPLPVYMREAVDDLLKKYAMTLRKAAK